MGSDKTTWKKTLLGCNWYRFRFLDLTNQSTNPNFIAYTQRHAVNVEKEKCYNYILFTIYNSVSLSDELMKNTQF